MDKKVLDVGMFEIEQATLTNGSKEADISFIIASINIMESIRSAYVAVNISIYDAHAVPDVFPIRGEETINLTLVDYFDRKTTLVLHVNAIDELFIDDKSESQSYVLKCVTKDFFTANTMRIQQSMTGTISDMAQTVHGMYSSKTLDIEITDGDRKFVIPSFNPVETMKFFATKAYSATNKSSNFLYFENREKYVFKTHEQLIKDQQNLPDRNKFYYGETRMDITERSILMNHLLTLKPKRRFNIIDTVREGSMISEVFKIDPSMRSFTIETYDHGNEFKGYTHTDQSIKDYQSSDFKTKYLSPENVVQTFITFEETNEDARSYSEVLPRRNSTSFYLNTIVVEAEIYGCNDIFAGSLIELNIPEARFVNKESKKPHPNLSGRYLVDTAIHTLQEKEWKMRLKLVKDAFIDG